MQVSGTKIVELVAEEFIRSIGAQTRRTSQEKLRHTDPAGSECGTAFCLHKKRCRMSDRLEVHSLGMQQRKGAGSAGIGVEPLKCAFEAVAITGRNGVVEVGGQKMQFGVSDAAGYGRKLRRAEAQMRIEVSDLITRAEFGEAVESISHVSAQVRAVEPVVSVRIILDEHLERGTDSVGVRCHKPSTRRREGSIEFSRHSIGIAKLHIGAPLGAISGNVHQRESSEEREAYIVIFGAVHAEPDLQNWRGVGFFVDGDSKAILSITMRKSVVRRIVLADSGQARQILFKAHVVDRLANQRT